MYTIGKTEGVDFYGVVEHSTKHMEINADIVKSRRYAALMHEGLHAIERYYRLEIPHKTITAIATWLIALLKYVNVLKGKRWFVNLDSFPIKIKRTEKGLADKQTMEEMVRTLAYFNKWPLLEARVFKILANMVWTFNINAKTLNEETGEWA